MNLFSGRGQIKILKYHQLVEQSRAAPPPLLTKKLPPY